MSLYINIKDVIGVRVDGEWLPIVAGTFDLDAYEFHDNGRMLHEGGQRGICSTGFTAIADDSDKTRIAGPLTAIKAVLYRSAVAPEDATASAASQSHAP